MLKLFFNLLIGRLIKAVKDILNKQVQVEKKFRPYRKHVKKKKQLGRDLTLLWIAYRREPDPAIKSKIEKLELELRELCKEDSSFLL